MQHHISMRTRDRVIEYANVWELLEDPITHSCTHWALWSDRFQRFVTTQNNAVAITGETDGISFADVYSAKAFACANLQSANVVPVQVETQTFRITAFVTVDAKTRPSTLVRLARDRAVWVHDDAIDDIDVTPPLEFLRFGLASHATMFMRFLAQSPGISHTLQQDADTAVTVSPAAYDISSSHWCPVFRRLRDTVAEPAQSHKPKHRVVHIHNHGGS